MNIKSLLLGSAAALVAVSGARAADVIMVEPEPVDYVRVCDVYGKGFFYIPGTETCMSLSGYVRMQISVAGDPVRNFEGDDYQVGTQVRTRLNLDVREETELGLLRAFARLQATNNSIPSSAGFVGDTDIPVAGASRLQNDFRMDQAYVQLGGLLIGYRDTLWSSSIGGLGDGLPTDSDFAVGDFNTNQINYTFALGGFSATVGIEDDGTGDVVPDVLAKLAYAGAWGGAYIVGVYDETFNGGRLTGVGVDEDGFLVGTPGAAFGFPFVPGVATDGSNDAFALKGGVELRDLLVAGSRLKVEGHYAFDPTVYATVDAFSNAFGVSQDQATITSPTPGSVTQYLEWAVGAGYSQAVGPFSVAVSGQYGETFDTTFVVPVEDADGDFAQALFTGQGELYRFAGNVGYNFTPNFGTLAEVAYTNTDFGGDIGSVDQTTGFLRFVRSF